MIEEKFIWIYPVAESDTPSAFDPDSDGRPDPNRNFMTIITELGISMIEF